MAPGCTPMSTSARRKASRSALNRRSRPARHALRARLRRPITVAGRIRWSAAAAASSRLISSTPCAHAVSKPGQLLACRAEDLSAGATELGSGSQTQLELVDPMERVIAALGVGGDAAPIQLEEPLRGERLDRLPEQPTLGPDPVARVE